MQPLKAECISDKDVTLYRVCSLNSLFHDPGSEIAGNDEIRPKKYGNSGSGKKNREGTRGGSLALLARGHTRQSRETACGARTFYNKLQPFRGNEKQLEAMGSSR